MVVCRREMKKSKMLSFNEFLNENFKKPWIDELPEGTSKSELYSYVNYIAN